MDYRRGTRKFYLKLCMIDSPKYHKHFISVMFVLPNILQTLFDSDFLYGNILATNILVVGYLFLNIDYVVLLYNKYIFDLPMLIYIPLYHNRFLILEYEYHNICMPYLNLNIIDYVFTPINCSYIFIMQCIHLYILILLYYFSQYGRKYK